MRKIGVEEHFHTQKFVEYMLSRKEWPRREQVEIDGKKYRKEWYLPDRFRLTPLDKPDRTANLGEARIKEMDASGIDMQVLSLSFPSVELFEADEGTRVARMVNDELAEIVKKYPGRFAGFAAIAPQDPAAAASELERAVKTLGMKGALVKGGIKGSEYLDQPKFWPIWEMAEKLDVPVYIHPKFPPASMVEHYEAYPGLSAAMLGYAADASLHSMRLILSGVFDKYPKLKVILGHLGEALPFWLWRMDSRWLNQQEFDVNAKKYYGGFKKTPSQYFKDNFYVSTSGMFWGPVTEFVIKVLGIDRILFATDYPHESAEDAVKFMESLPVSKTEREKIYHLNAERLLKL
jgi:5-carboxyvanillate decarboxylase